MIIGVLVAIAPFFGLSCIEGNKSLSCTRSKNKYARVGLAMIRSTRVRIPSLVNTMSTHQQEDLDMVETSTCSCSHLMWKPTSCAMVAKGSQIASCMFPCGCCHERNVRGGYP